jgi:YfiH family protein
MDSLVRGLIRSELLFTAGITAGTSTKLIGSVSFDRDPKKGPINFDNVLALLGIQQETSAICILPVRHTSVIADVAKKKDCGRIILKPDRQQKEIRFCSVGDQVFAKNIPNYEMGMDAAVSKSVNLYLAILHADCAPIVLYDPKTRYFSLIHAGTIGALTDIVPATIRYLVNRCHVQAQNLRAYIGPSICPNCYNPKKSQHFQMLQSRMGTWQDYFDLKAILHTQLLSNGLLPENTEISQYCTACTPELFFSNHKAKDKTREGRQMTIVGL